MVDDPFHMNVGIIASLSRSGCHWKIARVIRRFFPRWRQTNEGNPHRPSGDWETNTIAFKWRNRRVKTIGECVVGRRTGPKHPMETSFVCRVRRVLCDAMSLRQDKL